MLENVDRPADTEQRVLPPESPTATRRTRRPAGPRAPLVGLLALIVFGLLATFFAWVTAEPLWLAVGHSSRGTATVIHCDGHGLGLRCQARFSASAGAVTAAHVQLVGAPARGLPDGATIKARMVSRSGRIAYAGDAGGLALRCALGLLLVLVCAVAMALVAGVHRLENRRARWYTLAGTVAGPVALLVGMLAVTY
jgi:hypothetical protein